MIFVAFFGLNLLISAAWRSFYFARAHIEISEVILVGTPASCRQLLEELTIPPYSQHIRVLAVFSPGAIPPPAEAATGITQERVGKNGELFRILKFRTMIDNAESGTGPVWSPENDPRITPLEQFLRTTRLDETPQLINILRWPIRR